MATSQPPIESRLINLEAQMVTALALLERVVEATCPQQDGVHEVLSTPVHIDSAKRQSMYFEALAKAQQAKVRFFITV